jgi:hypothetical protein
MAGGWVREDDVELVRALKRSTAAAAAAAKSGGGGAGLAERSTRRCAEIWRKGGEART